MKCTKCGSSNVTELSPKDNHRRIICNDCETIMISKKTIAPVSDEEMGVTNVRPALNKESNIESDSNIVPVSNFASESNTAPLSTLSIDKKLSATTKISAKVNLILQKSKVWIKNPISMVSTGLNIGLVILCFMLLLLFNDATPSVDDEIKNYATINGYELADFDKFNSPAKENGLENTKVYFSGKIKEQTKVDSLNVTFVADSNNSNNTWGIIFLDNYIYSQFEKGNKATVFGYYMGYSETYKTPFVYYANGYMNSNWYEYDDSLGILKSLVTDSSTSDSNAIDNPSEISTAIEDNKNRGNLGDYTVEIVSAHISTDYKKRQCIIIEYKFTNNSDEATNFSSEMTYKAFQDGIELDNTYGYDNSYDNDAYQRDIKPGKTLTVYTAFLLNDKTNSVEIEVKEFLSRSGEKVAKTFELTK